MSVFRTLFLAACSVALVAGPAVAQHGPRPDRAPRAESVRDQDRAFMATQRGQSMPLPQIERRVIPHMGGADYLGPEFRGGSYRLKFIREGKVIWVDVDAATGSIRKKSGD